MAQTTQASAFGGIGPRYVPKSQAPTVILRLTLQSAYGGISLNPKLLNTQTSVSCDVGVYTVTGQVLSSFVLVPASDPALDTLVRSNKAVHLPIQTYGYYDPENTP